MPTQIDRTRRGWPWQIGAEGEVLKVVDGWPTWDVDATGGGGSQNPLFSRLIGHISAVPNSSGLTVVGASSPSATGSTGAGAIASTNVFSSLSRRNISATAATNAIAGQRSADGNFLFRGNAARVGGFRIVQRIGVGTGGNIASHRLFVGISDNTAAPTDVNPSTLTNVVLFGYDSGDTNCQVMHNDASGTCTKIDLGASFPKPTAANEKVYDFDLSCAANSPSYSYTVTDVTNGNTTSGTIGADIPANTLLMNWRHWMSAGGTSTAILLAFCFLYVESSV